MHKIGAKVKVRGSETTGIITDIKQEYRYTNRYKVTIYYVEIDQTKKIMDFTHDEIRKIWDYGQENNSSNQ